MRGVTVRRSSTTSGRSKAMASTSLDRGPEKAALSASRHSRRHTSAAPSPPPLPAGARSNAGSSRGGRSSAGACVTRPACHSACPRELFGCVEPVPVLKHASTQPLRRSSTRYARCQRLPLPVAPNSGGLASSQLAPIHRAAVRALLPSCAHVAMVPTSTTTARQDQPTIHTHPPTHPPTHVPRQRRHVQQALLHVSANSFPNSVLTSPPGKTHGLESPTHPSAAPPHATEPHALLPPCMEKLNNVIV